MGPLRAQDTSFTNKGSCRSFTPRQWKQIYDAVHFFGDLDSNVCDEGVSHLLDNIRHSLLAIQI